MDSLGDSNQMPKPMATSTVVKAKYKRRSFNKGPACSTSPPTCEKPQSSTLNKADLATGTGNKKRLQQYELGATLLRGNKGLPSQYFNKNFGTPSLSSFGAESTVNESDLLKQFVPINVSTPRSSDISVMSTSFTQFKHQLQHSDIGLSKLIGQLSKVDTDLNLEDESFATGELAAAKIAKQEQSWLKERVAVGSASIHGDSFTQRENCDMTNFFQKKSELSNLFLKDSPEKDTAPVPLVDIADQSDSVLSCSAFESADTTAKVFDLIRKAGNKEFEHADTTATVFDLIRKSANKEFERANTTATVFDFVRKAGNKENKPQDVRNCTTSSINILSDTSNICDKSLSSVRTVSSLDHLTDGKLPIETNRTELVWGCVQVGKRIPETFVIRNRSLNKLHFQIKSSSVCFRIFTDQGESEAVSTLPVLLYPAESRCFRITFSPTTLGAYVERLTFIPISDELKLQQTKRQTLMLYGYGGHAHIDILNVAKDSNMKMWLSLGKINNQTDLVQNFTVRNTGSLVAFVSFSFTSKVLVGYSKVIIDPPEVIVQPKSQARVTITFTPTKRDVTSMLLISSDQVLEMGLVQILSGAEVLRGRIRNIARKLEKEVESPSQLNMTSLCKKFPNEKMPVDVQNFTETAGCFKELIQNIVKKEIMLTLERDSDSTMLGQVAGFEDTFQSFNEGMITMIANNKGASCCSVEPLNLVLTPPIKVSDCVLLISHSRLPMRFKTSTSINDTLRITPSQGDISPDETVLLNVECNVNKLQQYQMQNELLQVSIFVDNEIFEVNVKIIFIKTVKVQ